MKNESYEIFLHGAGQPKVVSGISTETLREFLQRENALPAEQEFVFVGEADHERGNSEEDSHEPANLELTLDQLGIKKHAHVHTKTDSERAAREARKRQQAMGNSAYQNLNVDECGRLLMAGASVAVPFVGAIASAVVLAELLKRTNGGPTFSELKLRLSSLGHRPPTGHLSSTAAEALRGVPMQAVRKEQE